MNDRKRLLIMLPVLAVAAWLAIFGDKSPADKSEAVSAVAPARSPVGEAAGKNAAAKGEMRGIAPVAPDASAPGAVRGDVKLALATPSPTNLFVSNAPPPPPPPPPAVDPEDMPPPPPAFHVIGSVIKDGRFSVFLDKDNQTYVATPGAVIDGNRVDVVKSDQVQLFNLSTQKTQIIPIQGDK